MIKRYPYKKGEWPMERLKNKLSSLFTLLDYLSVDAKGRNKELLKNSEKDREDILMIINDLENNQNLFI